MKIETIELTMKEMQAAVQRYLEYRGLKVEVGAIDAKGYPVGAYRIESKALTEETSAAIANLPETTE